MEKLFKKALYTGIGLFTATTERLQKSIDELVQKGKISEEEGKKVVEDVVKNTEHKKEEYESKFRSIIDVAISKLNLPQGDTYDKLEKRIKSLEVKLGLLAKEIEAQKLKDENASEPKKTSKKKLYSDVEVAINEEIKD